MNDQLPVRLNQETSDMLAMQETAIKISEDLFLCTAASGGSVMSEPVQCAMWEDSKRLARK